MLLIHFFKFWYPEALKVFLRIWINIFGVLEEDLAVGLMFKLLFAPLFHDSSIFGRILSFFFRLTRIFAGILAMILVSLILAAIALIWFLTPIAVIILLITFFVGPGILPKNIFFGFKISNWVAFSALTFNLGLAVYINHLINKPIKKVWQVKNLDEIFLASKLKKSELNWNFLSASPEVLSFKSLLEMEHLSFADQNLPLDNQILEKALDLAKKSLAKHLTPIHFWLAFLFDTPNIENELLKFNLRIADFEGALDFFEHNRNHWRRSFIWDDDFAIKHLKGINRGWLGAPTPFLNAVSIDLTSKALREKIPDFVGRGATLSRVINILSQEKDRNVLLVGDAGTGKSALVEYLAKMIVTGNAPDALATKRIVKIDLTRLISGVEGEGMLARRVREIFDEVEGSGGDIIIYVDEIHTLGAGEAGEKYSLLQMMQTYLESDKFQFIGSTEEENYERILEKNVVFARIFQKVELTPATSLETIKILEDQAIELAKSRKIRVSYLAIKEMAEKSLRLIHDKVLPDSALSIFESCVSEATTDWIRVETVNSVLSMRINVPVASLNEATKADLLDLEGKIHKTLIDQVEAVKKVADTLRRAATSIKDDERPIGSFLFVGPTGVGKTELAKILSQIYFKTPGSYIRFDMSEYQTQESVNRLIGTLEEPGELTEAVSNRPYALLLFDEFEKADPKVLTLFLQILEDGRLTDAKGKHIDFTNTIIIATSNAASITIAEGLKNGMTMENLNAQVRMELLKVFRPELLNRFDDVVIFKTLSTEDLEKIVRIKLKKLEEILKEQGYVIEFEEPLVLELAKKGFDPVLGARPLRRLIQDTLEARLSRMILENRLEKGKPFKAGLELITPSEI